MILGKTKLAQYYLQGTWLRISTAIPLEHMWVNLHRTQSYELQLFYQTLRFKVAPINIHTFLGP